MQFGKIDIYEWAGHERLFGKKVDQTDLVNIFENYNIIELLDLIEKIDLLKVHQGIDKFKNINSNLELGLFPSSVISRCERLEKKIRKVFFTFHREQLNLIRQLAIMHCSKKQKGILWKEIHDKNTNISKLFLGTTDQINAETDLKALEKEDNLIAVINKSIFISSSTTGIKHKLLISYLMYYKFDIKIKSIGCTFREYFERELGMDLKLFLTISYAISLYIFGLREKQDEIIKKPINQFKDFLKSFNLDQNVIDDFFNIMAKDYEEIRSDISLSDDFFEKAPLISIEDDGREIFIILDVENFMNKWSKNMPYIFGKHINELTVYAGDAFEEYFKYVMSKYTDSRGLKFVEFKTKKNEEIGDGIVIDDTSKTLFIFEVKSRLFSTKLKYNGTATEYKKTLVGDGPNDLDKSYPQIDKSIERLLKHKGKAVKNYKIIPILLLLDDLPSYSELQNVLQKHHSAIGSKYIGKNNIHNIQIVNASILINLYRSDLDLFEIYKLWDYKNESLQEFILSDKITSKNKKRDLLQEEMDEAFELINDIKL